MTDNIYIEEGYIAIKAGAITHLPSYEYGINDWDADDIRDLDDDQTVIIKGLGDGRRMKLVIIPEDPEDWEMEEL